MKHAKRHYVHGVVLAKITFDDEELTNLTSRWLVDMQGEAVRNQLLLAAKGRVPKTCS